MTEETYYSRVSYAYQGGEKVFTVPFDYIDISYVKVFINDVLTASWSNLSESQLKINDNVELNAGDVVTIVRQTPINERMVVFSDTSILNESTQNLAQEQMFDVVQEVNDSLNSHKRDVDAIKPYVKTVADNVEYVKTAGENISGINTTANNIASINSVNSNQTNIDTVAENITKINTTSNAIESVNTVSNSISDVHTVANNVDIIGDFVLEKNMVIQSKAIETGSVSTDADALENIKAYLQSSFDLSKFTLVGTPTITSDGIVTSTSVSDSVSIPFTQLNIGTQDFEFYGNFKLVTVPSGEFVFGDYRTDKACFDLYTNGTVFTIGILLDVSGTPTFTAFSNIPMTVQQNVYYEFAFSKASNVYTFKLKKQGDDTWTERTITSNNDMVFVDTLLKYSSATNINYDLKQFSVKVGGATVFSGHKTGTDTYTIGGNTVSIPYTLSKTSSKIVESTYRTQVQAVYNEFGYAPYYTLSASDFTLPMGEIYGMIGRNTDALKVKSDTSLSNVDDTAKILMSKMSMPSTTADDLTLGVSGSTYTAPANGYFHFFKNAGAAGKYIHLSVQNSIGVQAHAQAASDDLEIFVPVSKGATVVVNYSATGTDFLRFIYAKGSESEVS